MSKIKKWLEAQGIQYTVKEDAIISIILEPDCIWINGFGEPMRYDKKISIVKNTYKDYIVTEITGYSMHHRLCWTGKQDEVIRVLAERFKEI